MARLSLLLFGPFQATLDGRPVTGFESNKVRALLAYLAVEADRPHSRDELIGLLWPDQPDSAARASLREALTNLRHALGGRDAEAAFISITSDGIQFQLTSDHCIDVATFSGLLSSCQAHAHRRLETCTSCARRLREAVENYRGDFLAQFLQSGSEAFEEWALVKRERWHRAALEALYQLAEYHQRRREYAQTQLDAARQLELEPWREEAHRQMMRALAATGQRSEALAQYEACRRLLARELGAQPACETKTLFEQIKAGDLKWAEQRNNLPVSLTPLVGRRRELDEISCLLETPSCRLLTLAGPGGIGKTHLGLQAAAEHLGLFADGVWLVELAALSDPELVPQTVAASLGLREQAARPPQDLLIEFFKPREVLLVLDRCEHLVDECSRLADHLLRACPRLTILATSREVLNMAGEVVFRVPSLEFDMSFLNNLNPDDRAVVENYLQPARFKKGSCILRQGDVGDGCYLIDEGEVRLEVLSTETNSDSVLGYLYPGRFLGEFSLLDGEPRSAFAYAHTDVAARWFSRSDFESLCQQRPAIGLAISNALGRNLTGKLRAITGQLSEYLFADEADAQTNEMVARAAAAQRVFESWPEDRVDEVLRDLAETVAGQAEALAQDCVAETGIGSAQDKVVKIRYASSGVYKIIAGQAASGVLHTDDQTRITEIAAPMGVVFGVIPLTNPVSTIIFKTLICLKTRNALVYSCHHDALQVANRAGELIQSVLSRRGAPVDLVQWVHERASRRKTMMLMKHKGIAFILATGGPSLVKAAYSSGTPAIGVGPGNAPVLICADADPASAAQKVVAGKSFDNGVLCTSENNLVVDAAIRAALVEELQACGAAVLTPDEKNRLVAQIYDEQGRLNRDVIGKSARFIACRVGIHRGYEIRLLVIPAGLDEVDSPLGREKLAPVTSLFTVSDIAQGLETCQHILANEGRGHTAVIHTYNQEWIDRFGREIEASRILVNTSAALGCIGIGSGLLPSMTLGCGTFGGNSTTDNVTYRHLINIKRLALNL